MNFSRLKLSLQLAYDDLTSGRPILCRAQFVRMFLGGFWAYDVRLGWFPITELRYQQEMRNRHPNIERVEDRRYDSDVARGIACIALLSGVVMAIVILQWGLP